MTMVAAKAVRTRELEYLRRCVEEGDIALNGKAVREFESAFAKWHGGGEAIATDSGTSAIHLALAALGAGAGDVVLCPAINFVGAVNPIRYCGADPFFLGVEEETLNLDPAVLATFLRESCVRASNALRLRSTGQRVAAVLVSGLDGTPAALAAIGPLADQYGLPVVDDAAECLGAVRDGAFAGTRADAACFSFNTNKIITTAGGGMVLCQSQSLAARCRHLRAHACADNFEYRHDAIGFNYRMSSLCAAVGLAQLEQLEVRLDESRHRAQLLASLLGGDIEVTPAPDNCTPSAWMTRCRTRAADDLIARLRRLASEGIPVRPVWSPVRRSNPYAAAPYFGAGREDEFHRTSFCFKTSNRLSDGQLHYAAERIQREFAR